MTQLYHHAFAPWRCDGRKRVIADDTEWLPVPSWSAVRELSRVMVSVDVFEDLAGGVEASGGRIVGIKAVVGMLFRLIDKTPNLNWMLVTEHPENVAPMCNDFDHSGVMWSLPQNLWLGVRAATQAEIDARVPHLLRVPAAKRVLWLTPREELCFEDVPTGMFGALRPKGVTTIDGADWVVVEGGDEPMHPDWVRGIRDQCQEAGVPFFFKQWGECRPWEVEDAYKPGGIWVSADGRSNAKNGPCTEPGYTLMRRVGKAAAGRTLDGREWSEVPK
jgi:protein gp37